MGRHDGGLGLVGKRAVVGGWVKSSRVVKAKLDGPMSPPRMEPTMETTRLTCTEVLMGRVPLVRCFAKLIGVGGTAAVDRVASVSYKLAMQTALVRINDGSCVTDLQVLERPNLLLSFFF